RRLGWQTLVWTGLVAVLLFLMGLRDHTLWDYHEPYVGGIIREMASSGNWVVPTLNGQPYLEKPPLFYAMGAFCCRLFQSYHPWVLRLPSALLAMATVVWASFLGWRLSSARAAAWAGFMVATTDIFFEVGHMAVVDMTLTATVSFALGLAFLAIVERPCRDRWVPLCWVALAFTFLAKGVFGPVLVVLPLGLVLALRRDRALAAGFLRPNWGMAAALALFLAWVVPLAFMGGREYLVEVFVRNTAGRFFADPSLVPRTGRLGEHVEPFYFYLLRTPAGLLPWAAVWIGGLVAAFPHLRGGAMDPRRTFLPVVFVLDLALLTLSAGKRMVYILPVLPITLVHAAIWLDLQMPKGRARAGTGVLWVLGLTVALVGVLGAGLPWVVAAQAGMHRGLALLLSGASAGLSAVAVLLVRQRRLPRALDAAMIQWTAFLVLFVAAAVPAMDREWRHILEPYRIARGLERQGARVYQGRLTETQLGYASLELRQVLPPVATPQAVRAALESPGPVALLLEPTLYWRQELEPQGLPGLEVPLEAARFKEIWFRTPVLLLNGPAWKLHQP
ncbi:MAG: glycosyltransferase family 39 protein, partial [Holophaga sp.]|nr:glycosyltransferase family 39 protein [Holophaga sp.]